MATYKLQVQDDDARPDVWRDVKSDDGALYIFTKESEAREKLAKLFPVLVKLEQFHADRKRTRVVVMNPYADIDDEKED
jgi:iron-sulfur cluster repair protein YtfE (RIC family)